MVGSPTLLILAAVCRVCYQTGAQKQKSTLYWVDCDEPEVPPSPTNTQAAWWTKPRRQGQQRKAQTCRELTRSPQRQSPPPLWMLWFPAEKHTFASPLSIADTHGGPAAHVSAYFTNFWKWFAFVQVQRSGPSRFQCKWVNQEKLLHDADLMTLCLITARQQ